jgi:transcription initiation factor TFIIB
MSSSIEACEKCGSQDLIQDEERGELICARCGLVVSEIKLSRSKYVDEPASNTSTKLSPKERREIERLMIIDRRLRADAEDPYVLRVAIIEIDRLIQNMHLPRIVEENAQNIYRKAQREGLVLRGTITGFAAASVYAACRTQGIPRTLQQVSEESSENAKNIARMYRILISELNISVEPDNPLNHLSRITGAVDLPHKVERLAVDILLEAINTGYHTGKSPKGLAASALYIASKEQEERVTQKDLSEAAGVSTLTIRKHIKGLREIVDVKMLVNTINE